MIAIPTVRTFLGCIDLKVACIAIAALRMVLAIIVLIALIFILYVVGDIEIENENARFGLYQFWFVVHNIILAGATIANIVTTYWFILGVTSNNPTKMKYYLYLEVLFIIMFMLSVYPWLLLAVPFECYFFICSNSLYQECLLGYHNENAANATENTVIKFDNIPGPPAQPYNSTTGDEDMQQTQPQNSNRNPFNE